MTGPHRSITVAIAVSSWLCLCAVSPAYAAESPYLVGDWNGNRTRLADEGISFHIGYDSEAAHNATGGNRRLTRYSDQMGKAASRFDSPAPNLR